MTDSGPGRSAREIAAGAEAAADVLERKSEYARRRAASFRQGAQGEVDTAAVLAELSVHGWFVLHDRLVPNGGNIDHLAIGPGGVVVVDSKSWSGSVSVTPSGVLTADGRNKSREVVSVSALATGVEQSVRAAGHEVPVHAVLALTQDAPAEYPVRLADGPLVVGIRDLVATLQRLPQTVRPAQVDSLVAAILIAFPSADRTLQEALDAQGLDREPASDMFLRVNIFLYVEPWARSGHRRLYLNDVDGKSLGYKDLTAGQITVTEHDQSDVVRGILKNAHQGGLSLSRSDLPKIPVRVPGGRILGHLGRLWSSYLVAQHWRKGAKDRLYVTHAVMDQGIFELGHIDLGSGSMHPSSNEALAKDLREPQRYLERVAERYPQVKR